MPPTRIEELHLALSAGDLLRKALKRACSALPGEVRSVPIEHWNESVFRWLLVRHLLAVAPGTQCWSEWHRVDLVLPAASGATLIELKFYAHRPLRDQSTGVIRMKGGPSDQNVREFNSSVDNLVGNAARHWTRACGGIRAGYVVLAYCDSIRATGKPTYASYYGKLQPQGSVASVETIVEELALDSDTLLTCKLLTVHVEPAA